MCQHDFSLYVNYFVQTMLVFDFFMKIKHILFHSFKTCDIIIKYIKVLKRDNQRLQDQKKQ